MLSHIRVLIAFSILLLYAYHLNTLHKTTLTNSCGESSTAKARCNSPCSPYWLTCASRQLPCRLQTSSATTHKAQISPGTEYRHIIRNALSAKGEHRPRPLALLKHSSCLRKWYIKKKKYANMKVSIFFLV